MTFKLIFAFGFIVVASAGFVPISPFYSVVPVPASPSPVVESIEEFNPNPKYKFSYDVNDTKTGDVKSHMEERDGDFVRGEYSLIDADGFKRTVKYTADAANGFNAVMEREPIEASTTAAPEVENSTLPVVSLPVVLLAAPEVQPDDENEPNVIVESEPVVQTVDAASPVAQFSAPPVVQYFNSEVLSGAPFTPTILRPYVSPYFASYSPKFNQASFPTPLVTYRH